MGFESVFLIQNINFYDNVNIFAFYVLANLIIIFKYFNVLILIYTVGIFS